MFEITDEQILQATLHIPYPCEDAFPDEWQQYEIAVARAILALQPSKVSVQVPMTEEQVDSFMIDGRLHWLGKRQIIRAVEAHHGIKPKEQA